MAEELLDRAEVGAALEEIGRERVAKPVRVRKQPTESRGLERAAARGEKQPIFGTASKMRAPILEVAPQAVCSLLAERDCPLLPALAADENELLLEVDVGEPEVDRLLRAQPGGIDELEERAVAKAERRVGREGIEEGVRLGSLRRLREAAAPAGADRELGDAARAEGRSKEGSDCGELPRERRGRELARFPSGAVGAEVGGVLREHASVDGFERDTAVVNPARELLEISPVRTPGRVGERRAVEKPFDGDLDVHGGLFRPALTLPSSMRLVLRVRHLVLASWKTDRESVERALYPGLVPAPVDGDYLVSLLALRFAGGRLGRVPVPAFSQLNVRTYVAYRGEPAVFFLRAYVTAAGMGGAFFGAPFRPARLAFEEGRAESGALGLSIRYRPVGPGEPGELGRDELGLFEAAGLRAFRIRRDPASWARAELAEPARADVLLSHGFDVARNPALFYSADTSFETDVPPRRAA